MQQEEKRALIRGGQVITNLQSLHLLGEDEEKRVIQRISSNTLEEIRRATRVSLLPIEVDIELTDVVMAELGEKALFEWSWKAAFDSINNPLLGPLIRSAFRVFGINVAAAFKIVPMVWRRIYVNCGEMTMARVGNHELRVDVAGYPPQMANSKAYSIGVAATLYAGLVFMKRQGVCSVDSVSAAEQRVTFKVTWQDESTKE